MSASGANAEPEPRATEREGERDKTVDPERAAEQLEEDIEKIRDNLGALVGELDHRRHEALNPRLQLRRHGRALAIGALAVLGVMAGGVALRQARQRRLRRLTLRSLVAWSRRATIDKLVAPLRTKGEASE